MMKRWPENGKNMPYGLEEVILILFLLIALYNFYSDKEKSSVLLSGLTMRLQANDSMNEWMNE